MGEIRRVRRLDLITPSRPAALDALLALPEAPELPPDIAREPPAPRPNEGRPLRTSSYVIQVDLPGRPDEVLLVHGYTGAYDKVARRVAVWMRSLEAHEPRAPLYGEWSREPGPDGAGIVAPSSGAIEKLKRRGYLTTMTIDEEEAFFVRMAATLHHAAAFSMPSYVLIPTYQCNLRCPYCFQDEMRTDPSKNHLLRRMQPEMVERVFQAMPRIEAAHGIEAGAPRKRNIILFGGEPLLEENRAIIEQIVRAAFAASPAVISAISNATELEAFADLLGPPDRADSISFLQVTIDGPPGEHDKRRVGADGSGTFDRIARNITRALDRGAGISVRLNVDKKNIGALPEVAEEMIRRGWNERPHFSAYVAAIHAANTKTDEASTMSSWELQQALSDLKERRPSTRFLGGNDDSLVDRARRIFNDRADPLPGFRGSFCGAHNGAYILDPFGDIYACWERTGDPSARIGALVEGGEVRMSRSAERHWRSRSITSNPVCRRCKYASYCGGGCALLAEQESGTIHANHCDGFSKRFRAAVAQAYLQHDAGAAMAQSAERVCDL